jgi:NADH-quinone oxidoreductase subunit N
VNGTLVAAAEIDPPTIEYAQVAPMLIVFGVAVVGVIVEAFVPRRWRYAIQVSLALAGLAAAFVAVVQLAGTQHVAAEGALAIDGPTLFLQGTLLLLSLVGLLLIAERGLDRGPGEGGTGGVGAFVAQASTVPGSSAERAAAASGYEQTEVFPLTMFAIGGMLLFPAANDLLTMFVALEVLSLPLYLLCGLARRRRLLSQEAALKYFLLGAFSSAFFLFGAALIYGFAGSVRLSDIDAALGARVGQEGLLLAGVGLVAVGLLFKVGAAPFHAWTPDVYQGAPTPVTGFMAACTKVAAFGALLRVLYAGFGGVAWDYRPVLGVIAVLTMLVGSVLAVTQTDIKRLLAYSSIANAGYLLVGVLALSKEGLSSTLFYLVAYGFSVIAAFAVVTLVRDADGEATHLSRWAGIGRRSPLYAGLFTFILLAFAGIPLTSGFTGKFAVFGAAWAGDQAWLVIAGVITSMILAFPYLRVVVLMWLSEPGETTPSVATAGAFTSVALLIGVVVTVLLGVAPAPLLDLTDSASVFLR